MRWVFVALMALHGLIHGIGFADAFGLAEIDTLSQPTSRPLGVLWLLGAILVPVSALLPVRHLWKAGSLALLASQAAIFSAWGDACYGSTLNGLLLVGVVYSFAAHGPRSLRAEYQVAVRDLLIEPITDGLVTEADLEPLPEPVRRYLRATGSVGQPKISNFRARWRGQIRGGSSEPWMAFVAEQHNTCGASPQRLFFMDAVMKGLPVDVYHRFVGPHATFRVRVASLLPMVDAKGDEMTRSETVTLLNDLVLIAPGALVHPALRWEPKDERRAIVRLTRGAVTVSAELVFDERGDLVDFVSDDRLRSSPDGKVFTLQRWSTPVRGYRSFGARRLATHGSACWHDPAGTFSYLELDLTEIEYNVRA